MSKMILLIDDDLEEFEIMKDALSRVDGGVDCVWASGAEKAFSLLDVNVPDLIFVDLNMPKIDGFGCLEGIRKRKELKAVPVIIYSTTINDDSRDRATALGATRCIQKASSIPGLAKVLTQVLDSDLK